MQQGPISRQSRRVIRSFFKQHKERILRPREFERLIIEQRAAWDIAGSVATADIIRVIREETKLRTIRMAFPSRPETRHVLPGPTVYDIALSLHSDCYLTHHTALFLHRLVDGEPREVYVNLEQSEKPRWESSLSQQGIDMAFGRAVRATKNVATVDGRRIVYLSGKQSGQLGVTTNNHSKSAVRLTGIERSLIDAVVRPNQCGGVLNVLHAYRGAQGSVSTSLLAKMLNDLDFVYPYHQSIGFLLEKAGVYSDAELKPLRSLPREFDFYLAHKVARPKYSQQWRIYYPRELDKSQ